ncbi:Pkinase domain-containing protein [Rhizoctonia solani AG-1 IA]|uniref:Pkinase domain-containing protein n=1 Tax=Thanatephorus cucumeris (strain AG1-IA) TaxID=983506 RepID=L8X293_THACA|nr:Pkinase domain-containing protein [Rhizoctonia solani AG-1 IA]
MMAERSKATHSSICTCLSFIGLICVGIYPANSLLANGVIYTINCPSLYALESLLMTSEFPGWVTIRSSGCGDEGSDDNAYTGPTSDVCQMEVAVLLRVGDWTWSNTPRDGFDTLLTQVCLYQPRLSFSRHPSLIRLFYCSESSTRTHNQSYVHIPRFLATSHMSSVLDDYEAGEVIGNGSFGLIRKVRRKADGALFARKELNFERMTERDRKQIVAEV